MRGFAEGSYNGLNEVVLVDPSLQQVVVDVAFVSDEQGEIQFSFVNLNAILVDNPCEDLETISLDYANLPTALKNGGGLKHFGFESRYDTHSSAVFADPSNPGIGSRNAKFIQDIQTFLRTP